MRRTNARYCPKCGSPIKIKTGIDEYELLLFLQCRGARIVVPEKYKVELEDLIGPLEPDPFYAEIWGGIESPEGLARTLKAARSSTKIMEEFRRYAKEINEIRIKVKSHLENARDSAIFAYSEEKP